MKTLNTQKYNTVGFVVIVYDTILENKKYVKFSHMISGVLELKKHVILDMYDSNGISDYCTAVANFMHNKVVPLESYFMLNTYNYIPKTCSERIEGICGLWSLMYVLNRLHGVYRSIAAKRVHNISVSKKSSLLLSNSMKHLLQMTYINKLSQFQNINTKNVSKMRNSAFRNFIYTIQKQNLNTL